MRIDPNTLTNICLVAAERFTDHAKEFRKLVDYKPKPDQTKDGTLHVDLTPHGDGARRLAEQFELQAKEAFAYAEHLATAENIKVIE
ncbi:MAG: hypothetical protein E5V54_24130 [Mesorhizobium sp.]|nr:MAG: hypothetical protein E5V54_24130 [Mesorhizobium sp.]